jgi:hypothetical protein
MPELPRTLPQEGGDDGDARAGWQPDDEGIHLSVQLHTARSRRLLFLTDEEANGTKSYVEAVVFRFSEDGMERNGPSVKMEYANDNWLADLAGLFLDSDGEEVLLSEQEDAEEDSEAAEDSEDAGAMDAEQEAGAELDETAAFVAVADSFWAMTSPISDSGHGDSHHDSDSDSSTGHCWYSAHSDRILQLLSEWLDRMQREHGLLGRMTVLNAFLTQEEKSDWFRQLPGLARPVAKVSNGPFERPHKGPNLRMLRARKMGLHKILGGARQTWNTCRSLPTFKALPRTAPTGQAGKHCWP